MNRQEKESSVAELREKMANATFIAVARNHGLTVSQVTDLRQKVKAAGNASYKVAKNTLMTIAAQGTEAEKLLGLFVGPTGFAFAEDPVGVAKVLVEFAKSHEKLTLLGGLLAGRLLSDKEIEALSKMPSLPELLAQIVGFIQGVGANLNRTIQAPAVELHRVIEAIANQNNQTIN